MNLPKPELDRDSAMKLWKEMRSEYAKEQVVLNNIGLVYNVIKSLGLSIYDDDLVITGIIGLVDALNKFDVRRGVEFSTLAVVVIRNTILKLFHKKGVDIAFSLDDNARLDNGEEVKYKDMIADNARFDDDVVIDLTLDRAIRGLNRKELKIFELFFIQDKTQNEIAKMLGVSQATISRRITRIQDKCKKEFEI